MREDSSFVMENTSMNGNMEEEEFERVEERDPERNPMNEPLLKRNRTLSSNPLALVGAKVSYIESLDYEINENDLFKQDWRSRSRCQVLQYIFLKWLLAFFVGLLTGIIATLINLAVENISGYKLLAVVEYIQQERYLMGFLYFTGTNFILTFIASILCVCFAPTAAGPGIPEIKAYLNGVDTPNMYGATTLFVKIVGSIGAVSAGLDLGKEGPLVHIGSCIASLLGQGAPVGGVLFALEEVASWWRSALLWRTFCSTAVVVVVLRAFIELCHEGKCGLFGEGGLIMFDVSNVSVSYNVMDIIPVAIIGILGGVLGSLYNYLLHKILRVYNLINQKGKIYKLLLSLSVSIFTSACQYGLPFLVNCTPCESSSLHEQSSSCPTNGKSGNYKQFNCPKGLITFGIAVPSGLFLPIILIGSGYGRLLGILMKPYTNIDHGLLAVLGAASLMAGSMRMTVSLCVIFLELTNNLLLLPITMIVLLVAKTVGDSFNPSIYEIILHLKGLPFMDADPEPWMRNLSVRELINVKPSVVSFRGVEKVANIVEALRNTTHNGFPVMDDDVEVEIVKLHGVILRAHLIKVLKKKWFLKEKRRTEEWEVREKFSWVELAEREGNIEDVGVTKDEMEMFVDLHPLINTTPFTVLESMSVAKARILFRHVGLRHMLVVPKYQATGVCPVIGILTRQDLLAYNILSVFPHLAKSKGREKKN
ncbi:chloride channel protein CLC-c [Trifolium repens]|nr:chloride channel protein CLC-c [Trifolium repens]